MDGQVVNAGGSLTGGSLARNSGLLSRASEIERIRAQADQLREQAEQAAAALRAANEDASAAEAALTGAKGELATAQEERIRIEAEHNRAKADRQTIAADIAALEQESAVAAGRLEEQRAIQKQAEQKLGEATLQISVLQGKMNEIRSGRSEQNQLSDTLSNQLQELRIESLSAQKDIESLRATIADIERRKEGRAGHVAGLRQEMRRVQDSIVSLQTRIEALKEDAASLRERGKGVHRADRGTMPSGWPLKRSPRNCGPRSGSNPARGRMWAMSWRAWKSAKPACKRNTMKLSAACGKNTN
ncbi:MAG: hypothetical protein ACLS8R_06890 [Anaeromassilibacillus sp.]